MSLMDCPIKWDAEAELQLAPPSTKSVDWVGQVVFRGTLAGAVSCFTDMSLEQQKNADLFVAERAVGEPCRHPLTFKELRVLAKRRDLPEVSKLGS